MMSHVCFAGDTNKWKSLATPASETPRICGTSKTISFPDVSHHSVQFFKMYRRIVTL